MIWIGLTERLNIYAWMLWLVVLALSLLRKAPYRDRVEDGGIPEPEGQKCASGTIRVTRSVRRRAFAHTGALDERVAWMENHAGAFGQP